MGGVGAAVVKLFGRAKASPPFVVVFCVFSVFFSADYFQK